MAVAVSSSGTGGTKAMSCLTNKMLPAVQMSPAPLPSSSDRDPEELAYRAVLQSAAIVHDDVFQDPVNYWIGMFGKVVILTAVKQQGTNQQVNPEYNISSLNWQEIFGKVQDRTPSRVKGFLNVSTCRLWYENRIRIIKECFPTYSCHAAAIDLLVRHYSQQLTNLIEMNMPNAKVFYWENLHSSPPASSGFAGRKSTTVSSPQPATNRPISSVGGNGSSLKPQISLLPSSFCSFAKSVRLHSSASGGGSSGSNSTGSSTGSSPLSITPFKPRRKLDIDTKGAQQSGGGKKVDDVDARRPLAFLASNEEEGKQNVCIKIYAPAACSASSELELHDDDVSFGHYHPVFEHNSSSSSSGGDGDSTSESAGAVVDKEKLSLLKRSLDSDEDDSERKSKLAKLLYESGPGSYTQTRVELQRIHLLTVLEKLKTGKAVLNQVSWSLNSLAKWHGCSDEEWPSEFLLPRIEEKVKNFEIVDFKSLIGACRCLYALYVISLGKRTIPANIQYMQTCLRELVRIDDELGVQWSIKPSEELKRKLAEESILNFNQVD